MLYYMWRNLAYQEAGMGFFMLFHYILRRLIYTDFMQSGLFNVHSNLIFESCLLFTMFTPSNSSVSHLNVLPYGVMVFGLKNTNCNMASAGNMESLFGSGLG